MTYLSLYRRSRPLTFASMTGQEHITRTLSNALLNDQLAHAYLFCGPRGTGKTTAAKILARAMNCADYPTAEPCGKCNPCLNIAAGVSIDVIEMDAASNRGIDEIRELRERARFASGESRFKVYIIDEAHMLTPEACNAFLKTLEEPPQNVVFILATTDPSKLPATIVSRCQRFDFHLLTIGQINSRLAAVLKEEGWQADEEALELIARLSEGSLRDALGILEQCAAYGEELISAEQVRIVTGSTRAETVAALAGAALDNDLDQGLKIIREIIYSGRDLNLFMRDLTYLFSRMLLEEPVGGDQNKDYSGLEELLASRSQVFDQSKLFDAIELLHQTAGELRNAHFQQYILEISFIRLLRVLHGRLQPAPGLHLDQKAIRAKKTEKAPEPASPAPVLTEKGSEPEELPETGESAVVEATDRESESQAPLQNGIVNGGEALANGDRLEGLLDAWPDLLEEIKKRQKTTAAWLEPAVVQDCRGHLVKLAYAPEYDIHRIRIMEDSHRKLLETVFSDFFGIQMQVKAETAAEFNLPLKQEAEVYQQQEKVNPKNVVEKKSEPPADSNKQNSSPSGLKKEKGMDIEEVQKFFGGKIIDN